MPATGSERACGGAAQTSTLVRSEGQLPLFLDDGIVAAAKVRNPPFLDLQAGRSERPLPALLPRDFAGAA